MSEFKEFQGKTLDAAIAEACAYYDCSREKLEIEIIEDAKSGIFGLVGARKARINAHRVELSQLSRQGKGKKQTRGATPEEIKPEIAEFDTSPVQDKPLMLAPSNDESVDEPNGNNATGRNTLSTHAEPVLREPELEEIEEEDEVTGNVLEDSAAPKIDKRRRNERRDTGRESHREPGVPGKEDARSRQASQTRSSRRKQDGDQPEGKRRGSLEADTTDSQDLSAMPRVNLSELDQDKLLAVTREMILVLVTPILGEEEPTLEIKVSDDRMQVQIQSDSTGLLIGRDGQNLAAVQYLVARMISRAMQAQVRVQVDAGDYHSRQDVRLQELAVALADKVRATGKSQSTRPLSAYQRRVIHLALQEDPDVVTRSSGEGALKRVVVQRRKENSNS